MGIVSFWRTKGNRKTPVVDLARCLLSGCGHLLSDHIVRARHSAMTQFQGLFTLTTAICFVLSGVWFGSGVAVQAVSFLDTLQKDPTLVSETRIVHDIISSPVPEILPSGTSYLLLGVNTDNTRTNPMLEAIWVVTFTSD